MTEIRDISLLIDRLEELVNDGKRFPLGSGCVVDRDELIALIDQMRVAIPQQFSDALRVQQEREQILALADQEARMVIESAREEAARVLNDEGLLREARDRSSVMAEESRQQAEEIMRGADEYAIRVLGELEDQLVALQTTIRNGLEILQQNGRLASSARDAGVHDISSETEL